MDWEKRTKRNGIKLPKYICRPLKLDVLDPNIKKIYASKRKYHITKGPSSVSIFKCPWVFRGSLYDTNPNNALLFSGKSLQVIYHKFASIKFDSPPQQKWVPIFFMTQCGKPFPIEVTLVVCLGFFCFKIPGGVETPQVPPSLHLQQVADVLSTSAERWRMFFGRKKIILLKPELCTNVELWVSYGEGEPTWIIMGNGFGLVGQTCKPVDMRSWVWEVIPRFPRRSSRFSICVSSRKRCLSNLELGGHGHLHHGCSGAWENGELSHDFRKIPWNPAWWHLGCFPSRAIS